MKTQMDTCPPVGGDSLLTARQAADTLSVSLRFLWTLRAEGRIEAVRIGNVTRFRASDVQRLVREGVQR
jgi:excisionase family DNA binding protein